uniref:CSON009854 protein n=1 Tax=Culicoides sonorensis TaxID=179676 RepID=A0A336MD49_CULSO
MDLQFKSQCRSCMSPETQAKKHISMFEHDLHQAYTDLTQIQLLADSPYNNVCVMCSKLLQSFSEFRSQCLESNLYFLELETSELMGLKEPIEQESIPKDDSLNRTVESVVDSVEEVQRDEEIEETEILFLNEQEEIDEIEEKSSRGAEEKTVKPLKKKEIKIKEEKTREKRNLRGDKSSKAKFKNSNKAPIDFYVCESCPGKVFPNRAYYTSHLKTHKIGNYECNFCSRKFRSKYFLLGHIDRNHLEKDFGKKGEYACNLCTRRYLTPFRLKKHLDIHKIERKPCPHCGDLVKNLCSHMAKHNTGARFQCDKCEKSYKSQQHLQTHAIVHENKIFPCDICGRIFNRPDKVRSHRRIHDPNRPTFECPECHKHFSFKTALTGHMRTHSGERPFVCLVCGMAFALSGNLSKHMHSHTNSKPYMCKFCTFGTKKKTEFEFHLRMNHEFEQNC